ncbi:hypothetical protein MLD38_023700 [Melastoma candidum]|uniref:Uncharacterized protein n=1 Tax=Melastoma candidum TaxID=119954 RepID=A0ACB9NSP3_9MYRT|nr:hypothetical protein MLD38_023700 [Melastoma candidum]
MPKKISGDGSSVTAGYGFSVTKSRTTALVRRRFGAGLRRTDCCRRRKDAADPGRRRRLGDVVGGTREMPLLLGLVVREPAVTDAEVGRRPEDGVGIAASVAPTLV